MNLSLIVALIYCTTALAETYDPNAFRRIGLDEYAAGRNEPGDVLLIDEVYDKDDGLDENLLRVFYPPPTLRLSYYRITYIYYQSYRNGFHPTIFAGGIDKFRLQLWIDGRNNRGLAMKVKVYGIYVGPCQMDQ